MNNIKNIVMGFAIFILTLSVGIYGISTLYGKGPEYNTYCPSVNTFQQCTDANGKWINYSNIENNPKIANGENGYCEYDYMLCQKKYDDANRIYERTVFFIALPLGIIIIAAGALIFGLASVGGGLMFGGVGIILYGVGSFWQYADDWLKFVLSLVGLIIVISLAYYANNKWNSQDNNKKKK